MLGEQHCADSPHVAAGKKDGTCPYKGSSRCHTFETPTEANAVGAQLYDFMAARAAQKDQKPVAVPLAKGLDTVDWWYLGK